MNDTLTNYSIYSLKYLILNSEVTFVASHRSWFCRLGAIYMDILTNFEETRETLMLIASINIYWASIDIKQLNVKHYCCCLF